MDVGLCCYKQMILGDQNHTCKFMGELDATQRECLENDIKRLHLLKLQRMIDETTENGVVKRAHEPHPISTHHIDGHGYSSNEQMQHYYDHGLKLISLGRVGVVILAGGQGTRLGVNYPKGLHRIGLNSNKSLFQLQMETLLRLIHLANAKYRTTDAAITCFIMTSESTNTMTIEFLERNNFFGFNKEDVIVFEQGQLPCIDRSTKKIILEEKFKVAFAPTGNGGFYDSLVDNPTIMDTIKQRNLVGLHVYCVDNVLVKAADPSFVGCCDVKGVECGNKVIERNDPREPLGVFCMVEDRIQVVEYSEMKNESDCFSRLDDSNQLVFKYGNICNHYFSYKFLQDIVSNRWNEQLPIHLALKKVPQIDLKNGEKIQSNAPNGIKFEKFIFDVVPLIDPNKVCLYNVNRAEEFSPLKNATGKDSAETCLADLLRYHYRLKIGESAAIPDDISQLKSYEVSPLEFYFC